MTDRCQSRVRNWARTTPSLDPDKPGSDQGRSLSRKEAEVIRLELTTEQAYELMAAVEMSPFDHEELLQKLLSVIYSRDGDTRRAA